MAPTVSRSSSFPSPPRVHILGASCSNPRASCIFPLFHNAFADRRLVDRHGIVRNTVIESSIRHEDEPDGPRGRHEGPPISPPRPGGSVRTYDGDLWRVSRPSADGVDCNLSWGRLSDLCAAPHSSKDANVKWIDTLHQDTPHNLCCTAASNGTIATHFEIVSATSPLESIASSVLCRSRSARLRQRRLPTHRRQWPRTGRADCALRHPC